MFEMEFCNFHSSGDNWTKICGMSNIDCYRDAEYKLLRDDLVLGLTDRNAKDFRTNCRCFPLCTSIKHELEINRFSITKSFLPKWDWHKKNFIVCLWKIIKFNSTEFSVYWEMWRYSLTIMKFQEFNDWRGIYFLIYWPFVVICLDYSWVFRCWASLSSFITLRFACFGRYANAKIAYRSWNHSKGMKMHPKKPICASKM